MDQALARAPLLAWLERHAPTARELRRYARIFARSASSLLGLGLVLAFLLVAAAGPFIVPYPEDARGAVHLDRKLQAPSAAHWFGTDEVGNDIYTRVILGGWNNTRHAFLKARPGAERLEWVPQSDPPGNGVQGRTERSHWYAIRVEVRGDMAVVFVDGKRLMTTQVEIGRAHV